MQRMAKVSRDPCRRECMKFKVGDIVMSYLNADAYYKVTGFTAPYVHVTSRLFSPSWMDIGRPYHMGTEDTFYLLTAFDKLMYNISWEGT
jgi:hypothetical protein